MQHKDVMYEMCWQGSCPKSP